MIRNISADSPIRATIGELDQSQWRIAGLTTLKQPLYGTSRASSSSSRPESGSSVISGSADLPYGSVELSPAQQKLAKKLKRAEMQKAEYTLR